MAQDPRHALEAIRDQLEAEPDRPVGRNESNQDALSDLTQIINGMSRAFAAFTQIDNINRQDRDNIADALQMFGERAGRAERVVQAAKTRTGFQMNVPLMTELPNFVNHNVDVIPAQRDMPKVERFTGSEKAHKLSSDCRVFLEAVMEVSLQHHLTENATKRLMKMLSGGNAAVMIGDMIRRHSPLEEIVRQMEVMYAGLKDPDSAQRECQGIVRIPGETLPALGERIKHLAFMASRLKPEPMQAGEILGKDTFLNCLIPSVRMEMKNRDRQRLLSGFAQFSFNELMEDSRQAEQERQFAREIYRSKGGITTTPAIPSAIAASQQSTINMVANSEEWNPQAHDEQELDEEEGDQFQDEQGNVFYIPNQNNGRRFNYPNRGRGRGRFQRPYWTPGNGRSYGDTTQVNADNIPQEPKAGPTMTKQAPTPLTQIPKAKPAQINQIMEPPYEFTPDELQAITDEGYSVANGVLLVQAGAGRGFIRYDPRRLCVNFDECMKCGQKGHRAFGGDGTQCPLNNFPLTTVPCPACNKGGHLASNCPKNL